MGEEGGEGSLEGPSWWDRGEVKGHRCVCVRVRVCVRVSRLSAAVRRRLPLSVHGGRLVLHAVQVLLLGDGQHRRQDLVVLPVRQT